METKQAIRVPGAMSVRLAALGGAVFFALTIVHANLVSGTPSATDPAQDTFDYLAKHEGRLRLDAVLLGLAMPAALVFLSGLVRALRRAEGGSAGLALAALGGGVLAATSTVTGALVEGTMANRLDDLGEAGTRVWWAMFLLSTGATLLGLLLLVGATAVVCLVKPLFSHWFALVSPILALVTLVGAFTIGYTGDGIQTVAAIAVLLDSVWIFLVSIFLWRDPTVALSATES